VAAPAQSDKIAEDNPVASVARAGAAAATMSRVVMFAWNLMVRSPRLDKIRMPQYYAKADFPRNSAYSAKSPCTDMSFSLNVFFTW
jgi:hypothetical protein